MEELGGCVSWCEGSFDLKLIDGCFSCIAARGSIFDNERFVYFLDERVLRTIDGFNPFDHSVTLESAIRLANIAGFVRIIDEPTDAAESLESAGKTENASDALKAAWIDFLRYCVPKPWGGDRSAISLLVDLAVQVSLAHIVVRGGKKGPDSACETDCAFRASGNR
jgi:hypothetical protein